MVHKGLPDSEMFIHFDNTGLSETGPQLTTGVRYETAPLKTWDGWTAPARAYIENSGEHIDIHVFVEAYLRKVLSFHQWLDGALLEYHRDDLSILQQMQEDYARQSSQVAVRRDENKKLAGGPSQGVPPVVSVLCLEDQIEHTGLEIFHKIRLLSFVQSQDGEFRSERPISATITNDTIIGTPVVRRNDADGRSIVAFIVSGGQSFGLDANVYQEIVILIDKVLELEWAKSVLSRKFIETTIVDWLRSFFGVAEPESLVAAIRTAQSENMEPLECWIPIAHLEVEEAFDFGPVEIAPITASMIDKLETKGVESAPNQRDNVKAMFSDLRTRMQGYAAVVMHTDVERERAREEAIAIAQNAVGILRFFAPMAQLAWRVISIAPLGLDVTPRTQALVFGNESFSFSDNLVSPPYAWRLSKAGTCALREQGLRAAGKLIVPHGLNEFEQSVRASILLYSTGTTHHNHKDKLVYIMSSLEMLLVRHLSEAIEFHVEERMGFLLASDQAAASEVSRNIREAYRLRRKHGAFNLMPHDEESMTILASNAHRVIAMALLNSATFETKASFLDAIEACRASAA